MNRINLLGCEIASLNMEETIELYQAGAEF